MGLFTTKERQPPPALKKPTVTHEQVVQMTNEDLGLWVAHLSGWMVGCSGDNGHSIALLEAARRLRNLPEAKP